MPVENRPTPHRNAFKGLLWDYDSVLAASDEECSYCLSEKEVQIILATIDPIAWLTRWQSPTETFIQEENLLKWQGNLARKLMSGCCGDTELHRLTVDGELQVSDDGGLTWHQDPTDPRLTATLFPPLPGDDGDDKKCAAAANATQNLRNAADQLIGDSTAWATITGLLAALAAIVVAVFLEVASAGALTPLLIGLSGALLLTGSTAFAAAMTDDVYDALNCILYCNMEDNASFTDAEIATIKSQITSQLTGIAVKFLVDNITILGAIGLTNAARTSSDRVFDCSDCDCDCAGETIAETLVVFHGDEISRNGCNIKVTATDDGGHNAVTVTWDGTHAWMLVAEGLISPPPSPSTGASSWQWYTWDGSEHGPFTGSTAPIGQSVTTIELSGTAGNDFSVSWDVETP